MKMASLHRGSPAPEVHHLRPFRTYWSPWRSMRGCDVGRVRRSDIGLGHGEAGADLAVEQRLEPALLLLRACRSGQHLHVAGVGGRAVEHLGRPGHPPHDLAQRRVFEVGQAGAEARSPAGTGSRARPPPPAPSAPRRPVAAATAPARACAVGRLAGVDVRLHEGRQPFVEVPGPGRESEDHGRPSLDAARSPRKVDSTVPSVEKRPLREPGASRTWSRRATAHE